MPNSWCVSDTSGILVAAVLPLLDQLTGLCVANMSTLADKKKQKKNPKNPVAVIQKTIGKFCKLDLEIRHKTKLRFLVNIIYNTFVNLVFEFEWKCLWRMFDWIDD